MVYASFLVSKRWAVWYRNGSLPTADEIQNVVQATEDSSSFVFLSLLTIVTPLTAKTMTAPLTPQTPSSTLGSPVSLSSTSTLLNDDSFTNGTGHAPRVIESPSSASVVLEKLESILE
jgi:hypothetical protein